MVKKESLQKNYGFIYALTVLLITWLVTMVLFIHPTIGLKLFSIIMFIPAVVAIVFNKIQHKGANGFKQKMNAKSLLFGILYPCLFILLCVSISQFIGIGTLSVDQLPNIKSIITIIVTIIINLFTVLGEEYGWRGYLLPELTKQKGKVKATIILGIIWALYHAPVVFFLAKASGMTHPFLLCAIQACVVFTVSFPFSYCYYLSGNIIPVLFFHSIWNVINTTVLGDIYTNKQGIMNGNLVFINGEGLLGLVLGGLFIYWFIKQFRKDIDTLGIDREGFKI
jgi:uncharacterized protein